MSATDRKTQILLSAVAMFRQKGFASVSTRDVAEHAGLSRSHLYHYFADWDDLRREAFGLFADAQLAEVLAAMDGQRGWTALEQFIVWCVPSAVDSDWVLWLDAWDEAMHDPQFARAYQRTNAEWHAVLARIIEEGVAREEFACASSEKAARQLFTLTMGYAVDVLLQPSPAAASAAIVEVLEVACLLLQPRAGAAAP